MIKPHRIILNIRAQNYQNGGKWVLKCPKIGGTVKIWMIKPSFCIFAAAKESTEGNDYRSLLLF
jgi:hypothetical protein